MKLNKKKIEKRIDVLIKMSKEINKGPKPELFNPEFRDVFVDALLRVDGNGFQLYRYLNENGTKISYKRVHDYVRRVLGTYPGIGRPTKAGLRQVAI